MDIAEHAGTSDLKEVSSDRNNDWTLLTHRELRAQDPVFIFITGIKTGFLCERVKGRSISRIKPWFLCL